MANFVVSSARWHRVQGMGSNIDDLTLRSGRSLKDVAIEVGGSIIPTPTITRTIEGASSLSIPFRDGDLSFLRHSLLAEKFDCEIDGLHFRYVGLAKTGKLLTITLEDRDVAKLREFTGPKRAYREETTRAEFVKSLVREAHPKLDFYCPQLHDKQPIEKKAQGKKAKDEALANRDKGIGDVKGLTVKGGKATPAQRELGDRALRQAEHLSAPLSVRIALMEALIVESELGALSSNVLQGTEGKNEGAEHDIHGFLTGEDWTLHGAIPYARENPGKKPYEIAQAVQASGAGLASSGAANYGKVESEARDWVEAFSGGDLSGSTEVTEPFEFKVGKKETYWAAIQRLANEVNWRAFVVAGRFFFIDELELSRGEVRLAIDADTEGVESVDFDYDAGKAINEVSVSAFVRKWGVPPGAVVTVADHGPASIGSGAPPVKADAKGRRAAIAPAVKARTHEGKGRYIVSSIEVPLGGDLDGRLATATLKRPTPPLPEPANETTTADTTIEGEALGSNPAVQRMREFAEGEVGKPYIWGAFGPDAYDCSGFVSKVLNVGGLLEGRLTTVTLANFGQAGEGELVTVHDKAHTGDPHTEHVLIELEGVMFECGGISGGVGKPDYSASALAAFSTKRHPKGL